ncbi:low-density lipoprotein receptor-related protein 12-like [Lytechinus pictus]|uniref:low-density lipoprotein receptor-related protein 12-like n=1 Tax=Lytechinus pictus TaxID=7653 RepID=UPI0030B9E976
MLDMCDLTMSTDVYHSGILISQVEPFYANDVECRISITTDEDKLLLLVFGDFDIEGDMERTCYDALWYVDGEANSSQNIFENGEKMCGDADDVGDIISSGHTITLLLKTDDSTRAEGFRLVYTSFQPGPCNGSQFRCSNGRCIVAHLVNNTYNNCGDGSDEPIQFNFYFHPDAIKPSQNGKIAELGIGLIIGIAIAASLGLLIIIVCTLCIIYHTLCSKILYHNHHSNMQQEKVDKIVPPIFRSSSRVGEVSIEERSRARDAWM